MTRNYGGGFCDNELQKGQLNRHLMMETNNKYVDLSNLPPFHVNMQCMHTKHINGNKCDMTSRFVKTNMDHSKTTP